MGLNWSDRCCLCGRAETSYHNPDPVRDSMQNCCCSCNLLVIRARAKCGELPDEKRTAYVLRLRGMAYHELLDELGIPLP